MQTHYMHFCQQYIDPVWGAQPMPWMKSQLVRVTRNRLRKAHFEWVGNPGFPFDLAGVRKQYPLAMPNVAGNRLAEGKSELTGVLGPVVEKREDL